MIKYEETTYKNFGRCLKMTNGIIELLATIDIGPRIISFSKVGGENMFFPDVDRLSNQDDETQLFAEKFGEDLGTWKNLGGHRLWTSPEALPRTYYPDCEPVAYTTDGNILTLTPPPQRWTQQQFEIKIVMSEDSPKVDVYHKITNLSPWAQEFAPWALSVLSQGGTEIVPMPNRPTGLLHNRKLALWDYTKMNDKRVIWGDKYIVLKQEPNAERPFKFGIDSQHGWAAYFNFGDVFLKKFDVVDGADYPDDGMNFETYTNGLFLEMESLGVYSKVEPNQSATHHESWELIADTTLPSTDETDIEKVLASYVG